MTINRRRKKLLWLLLVLAAALAALLLFAKYLGQQLKDDPDRAPPIVQIQNQAKQLLAQRKDAVVADAYLGFMLQPNMSHAVSTDDFEFQRITDERGFPNAGPWPDAADIVVLGDSLVMAEGVGLQNGFAGLLDQSLPDQRVIDLGSPGAGLERQFRIFDTYGKTLEPQQVIAVFVVSSDLLNDTHFFEWLEAPQGLDYNEFRLSYSRRKNPGSKKSFWQKLQGHVLYQWAVSVVEPRLGGEREIRHRATMSDGAELLFNRQAVLFAKTAFDGSEPEFKNFRASLDRLVSNVAESEADLLMVLMPSKEELFAGDFLQREDSAIAVVRNELQQRGVRYLDLYPVLQEAGRRGTPFFKRDLHLNRFGNRVVAEAVQQWLKARDSGTASK